MYLYKNNNDKTIAVYSFVPDNNEVTKFKKKYLDDIKSVVIHVNNDNTQELLFSSPTIMFYALDRKESNGEITYIEERNNNKLISKYINGEFDSSCPVAILGSGPRTKSLYSGELYDCDSTLLFTGGHNCGKEFITDEDILLTGYLADFQPLLSDSINDVVFSEFDLDEETIDFFRIFSCTKERTIRLDDLRFMEENGLITFTDGFQGAIEKSEEILNSYNKVKRLLNRNPKKLF